MAKPKNSPARAAEHTAASDGIVAQLPAQTPGLGADETPAGSTEASTRTPKIATVLQLLQRANGATLDELVAATGWLPHSTRAALTGLRKRGHALTKNKADGVTRYFITREGCPWTA